MADVSKTLKAALKRLQKQRSQIDRQIAGLEDAIAAVGGRVGRRVKPARKAAKKAGRKRKQMSAAAKKAVSRRMKKYWAQRRKAKKA